MWRRLSLLALVAACGSPSHDSGGGDDDGSGGDRDADVGSLDDGNGGGGSDGSGGGGGGDAGTDGSGMTGQDAAMATPDAAMPAGVITGGPCSSGAPGATAYRIRWANGGGTAYPVYEVHGLPDKSRNHAGAYGYQIGFTASYVDPYLAQGGLQLDGSDFVDLELSTVGVSQISSATLAIYGRSYNTTTSGSFNWQTFDGYSETATNSVSNAAPYQWYRGDMTTEISPGDDGVLIRIKAGPSSGSLVVNRIELCIQGS